MATTNSLDVAAAAQGTGVAASSGSATTTSSGDLVIGIVSSADPVGFIAGSGYVFEERVPTVPNTKLAVEDQRQTTAGAVSAGATMSAPTIGELRWRRSVVRRELLKAQLFVARPVE